MDSDSTSDEPKVGKKTTNNKCFACRIGNVVETTTRVPNGDGKWKFVIKYRCGKCGVSYNFAPGKEQQKVAV